MMASTIMEYDQLRTLVAFSSVARRHSVWSIPGQKKQRNSVVSERKCLRLTSPHEELVLLLPCQGRFHVRQRVARVQKVFFAARLEWHPHASTMIAIVRRLTLRVVCKSENMCLEVGANTLVAPCPHHLRTVSANTVTPRAVAPSSQPCSQP